MKKNKKIIRHNSTKNNSFHKNNVFNLIDDKNTSEKLVCLAGLLYDLDRLKFGLSKMCYSDPRVSSIEKVKRIRMHRIMIKK